MSQPPPEGSAGGSSVTEHDQPTGLPSYPGPPSGPPEWPPRGAWPYAEAPGQHDDAPLQYVEHPQVPPRAVEWPEFPAPDEDDARLTQPIPALPPLIDPPEPAEAELVNGEIVWHQPPPREPFHAKHEKPGEWHTHPPDHLAFEHSPPAEVQPGVQRDLPTEAIPLSMLPQPWQVPFDPHTTEAPAPRPAAPRGNKWIALAVLLTVVLLSAGTVSAYLLLHNADSGKGAPDPATAVDRFLTALYTQQNANAAGNLVCSEARNTAELRDRVEQIKALGGEYQVPVFRWDEPAVSTTSADTAEVNVQLTLSTDDEKSAQQTLAFTVVRKTGWLVCDVNG